MGQLEVWLRGEAVAGVPLALQPVAHGLLQCREEVAAVVTGLAPARIWARPHGVASMGFHVRHAAGALDRLFTYARGEGLSAVQSAALASEGEPDNADDVGTRLSAEFDAAVTRAIEQLRHTNEGMLLEARYVGRAQRPTTVIGLLFHAAEHTQRHAGQLTTTSRIVS